MNIYLLQLVGKWISLLVVSIASFCSAISLNEQEIKVDNVNKNKNFSIVNEVVEYTTITKYTPRLPYDATKTVVKGENGIVYQTESTKKVIKEMVPEVVEIGTGPAGEYTGRLTGYGPDCKGCTGVVHCRTKDRKLFNLYTDGIYYEDEEYGEVRVLAAATEKFPCGTIIEVTNTRLENFIGIVLDTGWAMRSAWQEGNILIDLAFPSESDPTVGKATNSNVNYNVKRWGW